MKSAASIMGLDVAALKEAKDAGCRAFDASGRVHTGRLAEWLAEHPDVLERAGGAASYKVEVALKTRADRKLREHRLAVLRGEYVAAADVQRWTAAIAHGVRTIVDRLHQCAAGIVGLPVPDAEARLIEAEDEIISQLHRFADLPVGDVLCPHCAKSVFAPSRTKSRPAPSIVDDPTQSDESVTDPV